MELNDKKLKLTPKRIEALRSLGIETAEDLLRYYPFRYDVLNAADPETWKEKEKVTFQGTLAGRVSTAYFKGRSVSRFQVLANDNVIHVTIFNRPWAKTLKDGDILTITGNYMGKGRVTATTYNTKPLSEQEPVVPIYSVKAGIQQRTVRECIRRALGAFEHDIPDLVPVEFRRSYKLLSAYDALRMIHQPVSQEEIDQAVRTLKYEEFLKFFTAVELTRQETSLHIYKPPRNYDHALIERLKKELPFRLTSGQNAALEDILRDISSPSPMYRLMQGDVGCGKTIVAFLGMAAAASAGVQAALLAPTEVLARQHYRSLHSLFESADISVDVLYSGRSAQEKADILARLKDGSLDVVIGTHSLLMDQVEFARLGFVAADEQQRFGVEQRRALREKGYMVDFLLMSATPIPRTLASAMYGEMNVTTIETLPEGRKPVVTELIEENSFRSVLPKIRGLLDSGRQLYIITAAIEKNEEFHARAAEDMYPVLTKLFGEGSVALLHGRMNSAEKDAVMNRFAAGEAKVLLSTTVVEVGMNVVNATGMIIYDSERFGLSQLHQLRGRVQRGSEQGYCWLLTGSKDPEALERLNVLVRTTDGFAIAAEDLRLRGPGDILGTRQSGLPGFLLGNLAEDTAIINTARRDAAHIVLDQDNPDYVILLDHMRRELAERQRYAD
ncbi:MAG: ATP-dependent DNA helicase RecG [Solobacterium sp.]|nr:ATP-dependent DNA helicase RecG [Solobacterium sp.]